MSDQPANPDQQRVRVFIRDHTGNKTREVRIAVGVQVEELTPALINALRLPVTDPSGRPVTYHLAFNDRQIQRDETLAGAGVVEGATLSIVPEMTAGRGKGHGIRA